MVFLDANILLELALTDRRKKLQVIQFLDGGEGFMMSILSVHLLIYFGLKDGLVLEDLFGIADSYKLLDINEDDYEWAKKHCVGGDFEDALQVASAVRNQAKDFVTLDANLAKNYEKFIKITLL